MIKKIIQSVNPTRRAIVFDASTLISLSMNGLIKELASLKKVFKGKFLITREVKEEIIDNPIKIKRFELEALRVKELFDNKILELPDSLSIDEKIISAKTKEIIDMSNNYFSSRRGPIKLIHSGEASCLALGKILNEKKIAYSLAVDERTLRMLVEKPENLKSLLEKKMHTHIQVNKHNFEYFKGFRIIRSTELMYVAYKKGLVSLKDGNSVLDALLYALKFKGCAISSEEIEEIKRMK